MESYAVWAAAAKPTVCRFEPDYLHCRACAADRADPPLLGMFRVRRFQCPPGRSFRPCAGCRTPLYTDDWAGYTPEHEMACERCLFQRRSGGAR